MAQLQLLLIEDDPRLLLTLYRLLAKNYKVVAVQLGQKGIDKALNQQFDAIILDLKLPDIDGLKVCEVLRGHNITTPILIVTGDAQIDRKVLLLDSGANDYITKPFSAEELEARLRAIIRTAIPNKSSRSRLTVSDLTLNSLSHTVKRNNKEIILTAKEFGILECLLVNMGRIVTRDNLAHAVWEDEWSNNPNTIDVHIKYLRDKVDRPFSVSLIKTVRGLGYKIETPEGMLKVN